MSIPETTTNAPLLSARDWERRGEDPRWLRDQERRGALVRLRRGVYVASETWAAAGTEDRALLHLRAYATTAQTPPTFSHQSAALLHGLPLLRFEPTEVHIADRTGSGGRSGSGVRRHFGPSRSSHEVGGLYATSLERTLIDLAESTPFRDAVVAVDAGLQRVDLADVRALAARKACRGWRRVQRVLDFASPLAESPGESLSRVIMHELGLPTPVLQQDFRDRRGLIGRADFWWPDARLIGEFDGRVKYSGHFTGSPEDVLWREKLREDRLRASGTRLVRWVWADLARPERLLALLSAAGLPR
ncbi:MAG: hypothetical protein JWP66_1773 [Naasia sp.]|nr:hypothetical protein [Naasia sp.]